MNRADAYATLCRELDSWQSLGHAKLMAFVGKPVLSKVIHLGDEDITVEVRVRLVEGRQQSLRIEASALGPSTWRFERLDEAIVVNSADIATGCKM